MAHAQLEGRIPFIAASAMGANLPITMYIGGSLGASSRDECVRLAPSCNMFQIGITSATVVTAGDPVSYWQRGDVGKGIAGASVGAGAFVGVGSTNGVLAPLLTLDAGPSGLPRFAVGYTLKAGVAGDVISVVVDPRQII